jgi:hypothetical protein
MDSIQALLSATLTELGLPAPANLIQTTLLRDGYFAGWKFRYEGGYAILQASGDMLELFDDRGAPVKAAVLEAKQNRAA